MKIKKIFACALAFIFTAATIITYPVSATDAAKSIDAKQKIICNETSEETDSASSAEEAYAEDDEVTDNNKKAPYF